MLVAAISTVFVGDDDDQPVAQQPHISHSLHSLYYSEAWPKKKFLHSQAQVGFHASLNTRTAPFLTTQPQLDLRELFNNLTFSWSHLALSLSHIFSVKIKQIQLYGSDYLLSGWL